MTPNAVDPQKIKRVLVIKLRHHGDVLLTSPVFTALKKHAPHARIDALVYHETRDMLTGHPAIDQVYTIQRKLPFVQSIKNELSLIKQLRANRYDLIIQLTEHARGAWLARLLRPRYSVAAEYERRQGRWWRNAFTHLYKLPKTPRHTVEQHLDALRRLGLFPGIDDRRLVLVPGDDAQQAIDKILKQNNLPKKSYVHLHPTSRWLFKCWEVEKYAALIDLLEAEGKRVVISAAPDKRELDMVDKILALVRRQPINLAGRLSLKELAALAANAACFVGVDSVPMHIAAAMQTPTVALFGPSNELVWGPWQVKHRVLRLPYSCRPCGLDGCGGSKISECLIHIGVDDVHAAVADVTL